MLERLREASIDRNVLVTIHCLTRFVSVKEEKRSGRMHEWSDGVVLHKDCTTVHQRLSISI